MNCPIFNKADYLTRKSFGTQRLFDNVHMPSDDIYLNNSQRV